MGWKKLARNSSTILTYHTRCANSCRNTKSMLYNITSNISITNINDSIDYSDASNYVESIRHPFRIVNICRVVLLSWINRQILTNNKKRHIKRIFNNKHHKQDVNITV